MTEEVINTGIVANDGTGDSLRAAFIKTSNNFAELYYHHANVTANLVNTNMEVANNAANILLNIWKTNAAYQVLNAAYTSVNINFTTTNAVYTMANMSFNTTNAAWNMLNSAYVVANSNYDVTNAAYTMANANYVVSNAAFTYANIANAYLSNTFSNAANIISGVLPAGRLQGYYTGITGVGTITTGVWQGSTVNVAYGGTGIVSATLNGVV